MLLQAALVTLYAAYAVSAAAGPKLKTIDREISLRTPVVTVNEQYTFEKPTSEATLCFLATHCDAAADIHVHTSDEDRVHIEPTRLAGQSEDVGCYKASLKSPSGVVKATLRLLHMQKARPESITQMASQYTQYTGSIQAPAATHCPEQSLTVLLPSSDVVSYSRPKLGGSGKAEGMKIMYAGLKDVPAFTYEALVVHVKNNKPFLHIVSLQRDITVSHWGRVYVDEQYELHHSGARLEGAFSRWNLTEKSYSRAEVPYIQDFTLKLPASADYVDLTDNIGKVITLSVSKEGRGKNKHTRVLARPRFPLMGGWTAKLKLSYSRPLPSIVTIDKAGVRKVSFSAASDIVEDYMADEITTRIILPEGSHDITLDTSWVKPSKTEDDRTYTYLDTAIGRPTKSLTLTGVTNVHNSAVVSVSYTFAPLFSLLEPALLSGTFLVLFLVVLGCSRLDLTVARDAKWWAEQCRAASRDELLKLESTLTKISKALSDVPAGDASTDSSTRDVVSGALPALETSETNLEPLDSTKAQLVGKARSMLKSWLAESKATSSKATARKSASTSGGKSIADEFNALKSEILEGV